jgi:hypothetical protein
MNKTLIQNWNSSVNDRDEIYILGDLIFKGTGIEADEIVKKLNGKGVLETQYIYTAMFIIAEIITNNKKDLNCLVKGQ